VEAGQNRSAGVDDPGETPGLDAGIRTVRAHLGTETGLPGVGNVSHFVMMEKPREFNEALLKFLEQNELLAKHS